MSCVRNTLETLYFCIKKKVLGIEIVSDNIMTTNTTRISLTQRPDMIVAPIVTIGGTDVSTFYTIALVDDTFIKWYVKDVQGYDLLKGYDTYISNSGRTIVPYERCLVGTILLLEQHNFDDELKTRRREYIAQKDIIDSFVFHSKEEKESYTPPWYAKFSILSFNLEEIKNEHFIKLNEFRNKKQKSIYTDMFL